MSWRPCPATRQMFRSAPRPREAGSSGDIIVVLDDDPTGTQSVSDLPVLTQWLEADFDWAFAENASAVYVLTNTRSLMPDDAAARNREIVTNALASAARSATTLRFASRSDSTLRGHFPLETDVIADTLAHTTRVSVDGVVLVPAFPEAGRVTIGGTHYMRSDSRLVPIAETEFARDATFGYSVSGLAEWVEEKTGGRVPRDGVVVLDLSIIRSGADAIAEAISEVRDSTPIVADAATENDLRLISLGIIEAERRGKQLLYRVGPPFVRARIGQEQHAPLTAEEIFSAEQRGSSDNIPSGNDIPLADNTTDATAQPGGLIVVGSHVGLTSRQLERLRHDRPGTATFEIDVGAVVDPDRRDAHLANIVLQVTDALAHGDVIVNTSRLLVRTDDPDESLDISRRVSAAVVQVVQQTLERIRPRFVIAKGGITSSDVAAHGLGIRHAIVRGPMLPGIVSLWQSVDGPAVGIPYVVFAGNVGDDLSLSAVVDTLSRPASQIDVPGMTRGAARGVAPDSARPQEGADNA
jgi:uncharacterized protein YgbK (DUF1537 family)